MHQRVGLVMQTMSASDGGMQEGEIWLIDKGMQDT